MDNICGIGDSQNEAATLHSGSALRRYFAHFLDALILGIPFAVLTGQWKDFASVILGQETLIPWSTVISANLFHMAASAFFVSKYGGTPGKLLLGLRITDETTGLNLPALKAALRAFLITISAGLFYYLPLLPALLDRERRHPFDYAFHSKVVQKKARKRVPKKRFIIALLIGLTGLNATVRSFQTLYSQVSLKNEGILFAAAPFAKDLLSHGKHSKGLLHLNEETPKNGTKTAAPLPLQQINTLLSDVNARNQKQQELLSDVETQLAKKFYEQADKNREGPLLSGLRDIQNKLLPRSEKKVNPSMPANKTKSSMDSSGLAEF